MTSIDSRTLEQHGLNHDEYEKILAILGREPSLTELGIFSVMWSEHCSYKSSRVHLRTLPTTGPRVVQGPGENAGAVDVGDGLVAVFKIESHNHPSFIEPYQGAATGVGGIIRDIFTMGARPIALLNSLRFGSLEDARTRGVLEGVVAGIGGYGNSIGIPTVGGRLRSRTATRAIRSSTCSASGWPRRERWCWAGVWHRKFGVLRRREDRPRRHPRRDDGLGRVRRAVVGEAARGAGGRPVHGEAAARGMPRADADRRLVGIQDMGAAGLTCSTAEMGSRGGTGIDVDVSRVPQRETGMTPYEIMLSESQERMLMVVRRGREAEVERIFEKWDLHAVPIGEVTGDGQLRVRERGTVVAEIPNDKLADQAPLYDRPTARPAYLDAARRLDSRRVGGVAASGRGAEAWCSARRPWPASDGCTGSTTTWCGPTRLLRPAWGPAWCG